MAKKTKILPASIGAIAKKHEAKAKAKVEAEAEDIRTKYPEIAKMTVAEVVETDEFTKQLEKTVANYKAVNFYAYHSLMKSLSNGKALKIDDFKSEYLSCMDKISGLPYSKRVIVLDIGNKAYMKTVKELMKQYDDKNKN